MMDVLDNAFCQQVPTIFAEMIVCVPRNQRDSAHLLDYSV
jgi:hypothetical protein